MALSPSQKTLLIRAISAVVAIVVVYSFYYFAGPRGLKALIALIVLAMTRELERMLFPENSAAPLRLAFWLSVIFVFLSNCLAPSSSGEAVALGMVCFVFFGLWEAKKSEDLTSILARMAKGVLGIIYVGLLPSFVYRLLDFQQGSALFLCLLTIVFLGDTMAYLCGSRWGRHRLLPTVSPKKSIEGALGGLAGSVAAAVLFNEYHFHTTPVIFIAMGCCAAVIAQAGDLFESLIKRVAQRKDSGAIMPGHGGVLDRLDGVLFAAPVFFYFSQLLGN